VTQLFFFAGVDATHDDVASWKHSLERKRPVKATVFHWHGELDAWDDGILDDISGTVVAGDSVVGHSSGCEIANEVAARVLDRGLSDFRLIALDGYTPNEVMMEMPGTVRWSAENVKTGATSRNYIVSDPPHYRVYRANVTREWPLHFSLVNLSVNDEYSTITDGYRNCDVNTEVLGLDADA